MSLIKITARHKDIPEEAKDYAYLKAEKLRHYFDRITRIEFVIERNKNVFQTELIVAATRGTMLVSKETERDLFSAIELVAAKMEKQLVKLKEKLRGRRAKDFQSKIDAKIRRKMLLSEEIGPSGLEQEDWY